MSPCVPRPQNGELIYGCADARSPAADWTELAHHLKPFFFPSNGLAGGPHCTRAVIRELVRVITRVLLSGSDKGRAGALRRGPAPRGPRVCEASPFGRSLRRQGRPRRGAGAGRAGRGCPGPAWPHGALAGAAWGSPCLPALPARLPASSFSRAVGFALNRRLCASSVAAWSFLRPRLVGTAALWGRLSPAGGEPGLGGPESHSSGPSAALHLPLASGLL